MHPDSPGTALLLSPHLDDVAFSCGGIAATLATSGWDVLVATCFTRSMHPATGLALECQRDKGLADETDYMAVRRDEDRAACLALGVRSLWLDLPEAPHRGYDSAAALFAPPLPGDDIAGPLGDRLHGLIDAERPTLLLAPQGCGRHVDHLQVIRATLDACAAVSDPPLLGFYRDTPYVIRDPDAQPVPIVTVTAPRAATVALEPEALAAKQAAVACFATQLGFQFGGAARAVAAVEALICAEARAGEMDGLAERLLLTPNTGDRSWPTGW